MPEHRSGLVPRQDAPPSASNRFSLTAGCPSSKSGSAPENPKHRLRVTAHQRVQLEKFFVNDRSPDAHQYHEISQLLGMPEHQTRVWFRNKYAHCHLSFFRTQSAHPYTTPGARSPSAQLPLPGARTRHLHRCRYSEGSRTTFEPLHARNIVRIISFPCPYA